MNTYKMCFLILHYNVIDETMNCIASIKKLVDTDNYAIVVVDNGSPNGTGIQLKEHFCEDNRVTVLLSETNLGFARGNNIGFQYCKNQLKADFICALNNDTEMIQDDFCEIVYHNYEESHFAVMGPLICLPNNDFYKVEYRIPTRKTVIYDLYKQRLLVILNYFFIRNMIMFFLDRRHDRKVRNKEFDPGIFKVHKGILLNGCCLVFSPEYIKNFDGFNDRTFMYREEEFLFFQCQAKSLKMIYNPNLKILHYEDASTNQAFKKSRKKNQFFYKHSINSLKEILKYLDEQQDRK
ncbi:glycosyltransferase [Clostridiaceae bacterium DONG20-135]|uniref:Glycosyltransferase n=1 Tax=Copranaerobaculum intestinale TaxID=2692629 RepID=A0A6N8U4V5_9FIRM|nr:glycosyltransferase [Copranaerobaculum intestinale]MXQ72980.1 glycosyltransferase [Copranaerobaculum intestinale]